MRDTDRKRVSEARRRGTADVVTRKGFYADEPLVAVHQ